MQMNAVQCPKCETVNQVPGGKAGAKYKCVFCDEPFVVDVVVPEVPQRKWDAAPPPLISAARNRL